MIAKIPFRRDCPFLGKNHQKRNERHFALYFHEKHLRLPKICLTTFKGLRWVSSVTISIELPHMAVRCRFYMMWVVRIAISFNFVEMLRMSGFCIFGRCLYVYSQYFIILCICLQTVMRLFSAHCSYYCGIFWLAPFRQPRSYYVSSKSQNQKSGYQFSMSLISINRHHREYFQKYGTRMLRNVRDFFL